MPTYQYRCTSCGNELEVVQKFTDSALVECPECTGALRKIYNAVGVVFKGSGFYRTDSRAAVNGSSGDKDGSGSGEGVGSKTEKSTAAAGKTDGAGAKADGGKSSPSPAGSSTSAKGGSKVPAGSGSSTGG
ncbi:MAG: FmdB family zinc ribbon protein [Actinomycetes bacterium]